MLTLHGSANPPTAPARLGIPAMHKVHRVTFPFQQSKRSLYTVTGDIACNLQVGISIPWPISVGITRVILSAKPFKLPRDPRIP